MSRAGWLALGLVLALVGGVAAANLIQNPGFEDYDMEAGTFANWTGYGTPMIPHTGNLPNSAYGWSPRSGDMCAYGIEQEGASFPIQGGLYQVVSGLTPGQTYRFKVWVRTIAMDDDHIDGDAVIRVGVDPWAGTDPSFATFGGWMYNMTGTAGGNYQTWIAAYVNFTAEQDTATVFIDYALWNNHRIEAATADDAYLDITPYGAGEVPLVNDWIGWGAFVWDPVEQNYDSVDITWGTHVNIYADEWGNQTCVWEEVATSYNEARWGDAPDNLTNFVYSTVSAVTKNTAWVDQNWSGEPASASDTTATITWNTDNREDETLEYAYLYWREQGAVDWNQETPAIPSNWNFEVQLSGLTPGTTYEYYVVVKFAGHVEKQSGVQSFTTLTVSLQPTLINGDFAEPWDGDQGFGSWNPVGWFHTDEGLTGRANYFWDDGSGEENVYPPSGSNHNQVHITCWGSGEAWTAQVFSVEPGGLYRFRRYVRAYNGRARSSQLYDIASTYFVDPDGNLSPGPNAQQGAELWYWDWNTTGAWRNDDPWYWDQAVWTAGEDGKSSIFMQVTRTLPYLETTQSPQVG